MKPCTAAFCTRPALERRVDKSRRAPERLDLCPMHAHEHDQAQPERPRPYSIAQGFDPDETNPFDGRLDELEVREAELLKELRALQIVIRQLHKQTTTEAA